MSQTDKETLESFVTSALRSRLEESAQAVVELRRELTSALERVEAAIQIAGEKPLTIPDEVLPAPGPSGGDDGTLGHVHRAQIEMLAATEQVGLLTQLLLACTVSCPRVAFFIVRKDAMLGWAARGFEGARDADMRGLSIAVGEDTILGAAFRSAAPVVASGSEFAGDRAFLVKLGSSPPAEAMAVPILLRDKIAAVLYGDSGTEDRITHPELPQLLALHAGLCLETLTTRQKYPRPAAWTSVSRPGEHPAAGAGATPAPEPPPISGVYQRPSGLTPSGGIPSVRATGRTPAAGTPVLRSSGLTPSGGIPAVRPSPPPPSPAPPEAEEIVEEVEASPLSEADRKVHEEAKRFARLLVSEMVLYNEKQVEEGRRHKDIYERLKDDIDRSHQMYEQRISPDVRAASNYFYDEMVRTLANGDRSALKVPWA